MSFQLIRCKLDKCPHNLDKANQIFLWKNTSILLCQNKKRYFFQYPFETFFANQLLPRDKVLLLEENNKVHLFPVHENLHEHAVTIDYSAAYVVGILFVSSMPNLYLNQRNNDLTFLLAMFHCVQH